jgi:heterodisulfide reductase subunit A-like polyferredoxin
MVQCVGSREEGALPYCSRLCCTQAIRNARALLKRAPGSSVVVLNRDITTYGTLEGEFTAARDEGVRFLRFAEAAKPTVARGEGGLTVTVLDPGLGVALQLTADTVVLSTGVAARDVRGIAAMLRTELDTHGFVKVPSSKFRPVDGFRDGVYACGLATGPKVAEESLTSAHVAAARAVTVLRLQALPARVGISTVNLRSCSACGLCISQCPFQARYLDPKDGKARVDEAACWGCGVCAQVCPNHAASIATRSELQAMHQVDAATWA